MSFAATWPRSKLRDPTNRRVPLPHMETDGLIGSGDQGDAIGCWALMEPVALIEYPHLFAATKRTTRTRL